MNLKKIIALALCVCMVLSFFPVSVFAEDWEDEVVLVDEEEYFEPQDEYVEEEIIIEEPVDYVEYVEPAEELIVEDEHVLVEEESELIEEPAAPAEEPAAPAEEPAAPAEEPAAAVTAELETAETFDAGFVASIAYVEDPEATENYTSLSDAIAGAGTTVGQMTLGTEVVLKADDTTEQTINKKVTIRAKADGLKIGAVNVVTGGDVALNGVTVNGAVKVNDGKLTVSGGALQATLTLSGGEAVLNTTSTVTEQDAVVVSGSGKLTIEGGTYDVVKADGVTAGNVKGGTFGRIWKVLLADTYVAADMTNTNFGIGVVTQTNKEAMFGTGADRKYFNLNEIPAGVTIPKLLKDASYTMNGAAGTTFEVELDGHKLTVTAPTGLYAEASDPVAGVTTYTLKATVAVIGEGTDAPKYYDSLAGAIAAAADGDIIKLLTKADLGACTFPGIGFTIDVNEKTLTLTGQHTFAATDLTIKNGNVIAKDAGGNGVFSTNYGTDMALTLDDVVLETSNVTGLTCMNSKRDSLTIKGSQLTLKGCGYYVLYTQGAAVLIENSSIEISDSMTGSEAFEAPFSYSVYNIKNSTIELKDGVARNAFYNVAGVIDHSTIILRSQGDGIVMAENMSGFTGDVNTLRIINESILSVTTSGENTKAFSFANNEQHISKSEDSTILPAVFEAAIGEVYYPTLAAAAAAAQSGDTIELLTDAIVYTRTYLKSGVTLDGKGHTVKPSNDADDYTNPQLAVSEPYAASSSLPLIEISADVKDVVIKDVTLSTNSWYVRALISTGTGSSITLEDVNLHRDSVTARGADALALNGTCTIKGDFETTLCQGTWSAISFNGLNCGLDLTDCDTFTVTDQRDPATSQPVICAYERAGAVSGTITGISHPDVYYNSETATKFAHVINNGDDAQTGYEPLSSSKIAESEKYSFVHTTAQDENTFYTTFKKAAAAAVTTDAGDGGVVTFNATPTDLETYELTAGTLKVKLNGKVTGDAAIKALVTAPDGKAVNFTTEGEITTYSLVDAKFIQYTKANDGTWTKIVGSYKTFADALADYTSGNFILVKEDTTYALQSDDIIFIRPAENVTFTASSGVTGYDLKEEYKPGSDTTKYWLAPATYTITYVDATYPATSPAPASYTYGVASEAIPDPVDNNKNFVSWTAKTADGTTVELVRDEQAKTSVIRVGTYGNVTMTANWEGKSYTVTFDPDNGQPTFTQTVIYPAPLTEPTGYTKAGYELKGWYRGTNEWKWNWSVTQNGIVLKAGWNALPQTITFNADGGTVMGEATHTVTANTDEALTIKGNMNLIPVRPGFAFAGWFAEGATEKTLIGDLDATMPAGGKNYTAHWNADTFTIKYQDGDSLASVSQTATYDAVAMLWDNLDGESHPVFTKDGYTLTKWKLGDIEYTLGQSLTAEQVNALYALATENTVTFSAEWEKDTYTVTFDANGGEAVTATQYNVDTKAVLPKTTLAGYTFKGWKVISTDGNWHLDEIIQPGQYGQMLGNVSLQAQWNANVAQLTDGAGTVTPYDSIEGAKAAYEEHPNYYHGIELIDTTVEYTLPYGENIVILNPGEWTPAGDKSLDSVKPYYVVPGEAEDPDAVKFTTADCEAAVYDLTITVSRDQTWEYHTDLTASTLAEYFDTFAQAAAAVVDQTGDVNPEVAGTYNAKAVEVRATAVPDEHKYGLNVDSTVVFKGAGQTDLFTAQAGVIYDDGTYVREDTPLDGYNTVSAAYKIKTVSFDPGIGTGTAEDITITYGSTADLPAASTFTKSDYSFNGYTSGDVVVQANQTELTVEQVNALIIATEGDTATLTAQYVGDTITVVFNSNNGTGTMEEQEFTAGDSKKLTANSFERTGYNFNGWVLNAEAETVMYADEATVGPTVFAALNKAAVDHQVTLYALWSPDVFQIAFNKNTGTGTDIPSVSASYDSPVNLANNTYKKTGYSFVSWNTQEDGEGTNFANSAELTAEQVNALHALVVDDTVTLYAKWNANDYTIVFDANNESATGTTASVSATYDVEATLTSNGFELVGYNFAGWATKPDGTGKTYADGVIVKNLSNTPDAEVTLYAQWTADTFNIAFSANDTAATGTTATLEGVKYDAESATLPANGFRKTGNTFNLWSDGTNTYGNKASLTSDQIHYLYSLATADDEGVKTVTLNATWKVNTYKISFNNNNGEGTMDQVSYTYGAAAVELPLCTFTYHGKVFAGWNTKANGSGTSYEDGAAISPASNLTLYAQWEDDTFTVVFNGNNETSGTMADLPLTYGVSTNLPENAFLRTGFGFEGWSLDPNAVTADFAGDKDLIGPTRMEALYNAVGDNDTVTIYAVWAAVNTEVTFDANKGKVINPATEKSVSKYTVTGDYGASIVWPADPTRTGYTFSGWSTDEFDTFPAEDVTVTAAWTVNQYTVSFYDVNADGTKTHYEGKDVTQDYNTAFTPPTVEKEGFDFAGWFDEAGNQMPDKIPAANTAYYAKWTGEDVVITWIDRSETIASRTQKNGELTDQPSYEGRSYGNKIVDPTDPWSPEVSQYVNGAAVYTLKWKDIISVDFIANGINVGSGSAIDGHPIMEAPNVKKDGKDPVWHINGKDGDVYTIGVTPVDSSIATLVASWDDTPATLADFTYNMSLTENLNMKFFVRNVKDNFEDYTVKVSIDGEDDHVFYLDNAEENIFTIAEFDARRMTDEIHVVVTDGDAVALTGVYTIAGYCNAVIESTGNEKLKELANAILVYGANAQRALNYKTDNLPTDDYDVSGVIIPTATATTKGSVTGVSRFGNQVMVDSNVTLRVLLQVDSTASLDDYTVTVNDTEVVPVKQSATIWYVDIPVSALKLGERQIVYVEDDNGMATYSLNTIVPIRRISNDLTKALYAYYDAATAYATSI